MKNIVLSNLFNILFYLCIMKNVNVMDEMLTKRGFVKDAEHEGWRKKDWVIRKNLKNIEIYNDPITKNRCKYLCTGLDEEKFRQILEEIEELG